MKKKLTIILCCISTAAAAQQAPPKFETLKLNSSPAYILMGVEPENIQRPSSPKQFVAGVQSAIVNQKLKPNVALEVTPYYWKNPIKDSSRFDANKYLLQSSNPLRSILQTLSISLGTSESDTVVFGKLKPGTGLGAGIRFSVFEGRASGARVEKLRMWNRLMHKQAIVSEVAGRLATGGPSTTAREALEEAIATYLIGSTDVRSRYYVGDAYDPQTLISEIRAKMGEEPGLAGDKNGMAWNQLATGITKQEAAFLTEFNNTEFPFAKTGFMLEFAAGSAFVFEESEWKGGKYAKSAMWLTPSWRWNVADDETNVSLVDAIAVFRYTFNNKADSVDVANYFDTGLKFQYTHNRWSLSAEGVYRLASQPPKNLARDYTYRFVTSLDYKLNDMVTFKFSFGSTFDGNTATYTDPKKMFAAGGLNLGIFDGKK